ncbi:MAG: methyltransferase domain-containing protein [Alphaproteobacteria bacterium]|nr:methyltransferase domain-containing protein [Alphaproteobacteria bacterium]
MLILLKTLLRSIVVEGDLELIDAKGGRHKFGDGTGVPVAIEVHDERAYARLAIHPTLAVGEAFMDGTLTIERGTLRDFLTLMVENMRRHKSPAVQLATWARWAIRRLSQYNPAGKARANVAHHYDLSREFYDLFLGRERQYSCAYFEYPGQSLDDAQRAKKRHIAAKLLLRDGQRVLDIGSGWGGLALYLAQLADVRVTGVTLSGEQLASAKADAASTPEGKRVDYRLQDYRDIAEQYDRIVSVGMFEHVGVGHYRTFFRTLARSLKDDGIALLHTIGRFDGPAATNPWLAKYIFPGGYSPALSEILPAIEKEGLIVTDIEVLRLHYAETLAAWEAHFQANREKIAALYDERFCRMWEFYLIASELSFRTQESAVFQIQIAKDQKAVPLTRDEIIAWEQAQRAHENPPTPPARLAGG